MKCRNFPEGSRGQAVGLSRGRELKYIRDETNEYVVKVGLSRGRELKFYWTDVHSPRGRVGLSRGRELKYAKQ